MGRGMWCIGYYMGMGYGLVIGSRVSGGVCGTVRVENFEGVKFRAFQYSVLFGKFRGY